MRGAERIDHWSITAGGRSSQRGLAIQGVRKAEPRPDAAIPIRRQRTGILPARAASCEYKGAWSSIGAGVRHTRIEVAEDVVSVYRRQVDLIPQPKVECQTLRYAPVVLKIHLLGPILAGNISGRIQAVARRLAQQE